MRKTTILLCLVGWLAQAGAQTDKFQLSVLLSPSYETLNDRNTPNIFEYKLSYNVGLEYKLFFAPDVSLTTGLLFQNKGFKTQPTYTDPNITQGNIVISARYLGIPVNLDGHIRLAEKTDLLMTAGFTASYLVHESFIGRRINGEEEIQEGVFNTKSDDRQDLDIFRNMYWGLNLGLGICQYIKSKLVLTVQPYYRRQINDAIDRNAPVSGTQDPRLDSFCMDVKLGYYFNKNIRNRKKTF